MSEINYIILGSALVIFVSNCILSFGLWQMQKAQKSMINVMRKIIEADIEE